MNAMMQAPATITSARRALKELLAQAGIDSADVDARLLIEHALGIDRTTVMTQGERVLSAGEIAAIDVLTARRLKHEPVARIVGFKEFWSLTLAVGPDVLVPRPETETVVELALDMIGKARHAEQLRVLDIGIGSGALLLALLSELPNATGVGTDISNKALHIARANAERHGLASRCQFINADIAAGVHTDVRGPFDLIVSNPPYIVRNDIAGLEPEVRDYDPAVALDGGPEGLSCYRAIAAEARRLLAPGGRLVVEIGMGQDGTVSGLFSAVGLTVIETRPDLAGIPRALGAFLAP
jgi:release factor glutamine methyltransferase